MGVAKSISSGEMSPYATSFHCCQRLLITWLIMLGIPLLYATGKHSFLSGPFGLSLSTPGLGALSFYTALRNLEGLETS